MSQARIRPIAEADAARWRELFTAYGVFYETSFSEQVLDGVWQWLMDGSRDMFGLVAEQDGDVIGFAHVRVQADTFTAGSRLVPGRPVRRPGRARGRREPPRSSKRSKKRRRRMAEAPFAGSRPPTMRPRSAFTTGWRKRTTWVTYELEVH